MNASQILCNLAALQQLAPCVVSCTVAIRAYVDRSHFLQKIRRAAAPVCTPGTPRFPLQLFDTRALCARLVTQSGVTQYLEEGENVDVVTQESGVYVCISKSRVIRKNKERNKACPDPPFEPL